MVDAQVEVFNHPVNDVLAHVKLQLGQAPDQLDELTPCHIRLLSQGVQVHPERQLWSETTRHRATHLHAGVLQLIRKQELCTQEASKDLAAGHRPAPRTGLLHQGLMARATRRPPHQAIRDLRQLDEHQDLAPEGWRVQGLCHEAEVDSMTVFIQLHGTSTFILVDARFVSV